MAVKDLMVKSKDGDIHAWLIVAASTFIYYLSGTLTFIQGKKCNIRLETDVAISKLTIHHPVLFLVVKPSDWLVSCVRHPLILLKEGTFRIRSSCNKFLHISFELPHQAKQQIVLFSLIFFVSTQDYCYENFWWNLRRERWQRHGFLVYFWA